VQSDAFLPESETMLVACGTSNATQAMVFPGTTPSNMLAAGMPPIPPPNILVTNLGTGVVWVSFTLISNRTAAIPAAGQTSIEVPINPGTSQTFRCPWGGSAASQGAEGTPQTPFIAGQGPPGSATIYCNTIATVAGNIAVTFGEGV
jgi:hypothetical protein